MTILIEIKRKTKILLDYNFTYPNSSLSNSQNEIRNDIKIEMIAPSEHVSDNGNEYQDIDNYRPVQKRPTIYFDENSSYREEYSTSYHHENGNSQFYEKQKNRVMVKKNPFRVGSQSLRKMKKEIRNNKENIEEENDVIKNKNEKNAAHALRDWINRRITGYLVFRNTMKKYESCEGFMRKN